MRAYFSPEVKHTPFSRGAIVITSKHCYWGRKGALSCSHEHQAERQNLMNDSFAGAHKFRRARHINKFQSAWLSYLFVTGGVINLNSAHQWQNNRAAHGILLTRARRTCKRDANGGAEISNFLRLIILTLLTVKCTGINRAWESAPRVLGAHPPRIKISFSANESTNISGSSNKKEKMLLLLGVEI